MPSSMKNVGPNAVVALLAAVVRIAFKSIFTGDLGGDCRAGELIRRVLHERGPVTPASLRPGSDAPAGISGAFRTSDHVCAWRYLTVDPSDLKMLSRRGASTSPGLPNRPDSMVRKRRDRPTSHP